MNHEATTEILNRLLAVINRSLPMYLAEAAPWTHPGDEQAAQTLERIVADQRRDVSRLAELIIARAGRCSTGP